MTLVNVPSFPLENPMLPSQSIVMTIGAQSAILYIDDTERGRKYTMCIVGAEDPGTTGNTTRAYSVSVRSVTLPQSNFLEALLLLAGLKTS